MTVRPAARHRQHVEWQRGGAMALHVLGLSLQEIRRLVDMYESPSDTEQQLRAFLQVLAEHRALLERQREDIDVTLAEIAQHEQRCRQTLVPKTPRRRQAA